MRGHRLHERGQHPEQPVAVGWLSGGIGPSTRVFTTNATEDLRASALQLEPDNDRHSLALLRGEHMPTKETAQRPSSRRRASRTPSKRLVALSGGVSKQPASTTGRRGRARTCQALARKTQARVPRERRQGVRRPQVGPKARALTRRWEDAPGRAPNGCCRRARRHCGLCPSARTSNLAAGNRTRAADHSRHHPPAGKRRAARRRHDKHGDNTPEVEGSS